jgi:hypothetical protein
MLWQIAALPRRATRNAEHRVSMKGQLKAKQVSANPGQNLRRCLGAISGDTLHVPARCTVSAYRRRHFAEGPNRSDQANG